MAWSPQTQRRRFFCYFAFFTVYWHIESSKNHENNLALIHIADFSSSCGFPLEYKQLQWYPSMCWSSLSDTTVNFDDIIAVGRSEGEFKDRVNQLLNRFQDYGFHFSKKTMPIYLRSIKYLALVFNSHGRRLEMVSSISDMSATINISNLCSFLSLLSFCSTIFGTRDGRRLFSFNQ